MLWLGKSNVDLQSEVKARCSQHKIELEIMTDADAVLCGVHGAATTTQPNSLEIEMFTRTR